MGKRQVKRYVDPKVALALACSIWLIFRAYAVAVQELHHDGAQQHDQLRSAASHGHAVHSNGGGNNSDEVGVAVPESPPGFSGTSSPQVLVCPPSTGYIKHSVQGRVGRA